MALLSRGVALLLCCMACGAADAQESAQFSLTGSILPGVCRLEVDDVDLGSFYAREFSAVGTTKAWATTYVRVTDCDPLVTRVALNLSGIADRDDARYFNGLNGIGIELERETPSSPVSPAGTTLQYGTSNGVYPLRARFHQTAAIVAAGSVNAAVTVSMTYN